MIQAMEHPLEKLIAENPKLKAIQDDGIDLYQLWDNLQLTPEERLQQHARFLKVFRAFHNTANQ